MNDITYCDFGVMRGDTFTKRLTITDSDGAVVDVSGWTFLGQVRASVDAAVLGTMSFNLAEAAAGVIVLTLSAVTTAAFAETTLVYDVQATLPDASVKTLVRGKLQVTYDVSRSA